MKKVILFENRPSRQEIYLPNGKNDVDKLRTYEFLALYDETEHSKLISNGDFEFLDEFNLLIFHRSYLVEFKNGSKLNPIFNFCKQHSKDLILFTGGVSGSTYLQEGNFQSLTISAKDFYSNIIDFLPSYSLSEERKNLLGLKYGEKWEGIFMLQLRELLTMVSQDDQNELKVLERVNYLVDLLGLTSLTSDYGEILSILNDKIKLSLAE